MSPVLSVTRRILLSALVILGLIQLFGLAPNPTLSSSIRTNPQHAVTVPNNSILRGFPVSQRKGKKFCPKAMGKPDVYQHTLRSKQTEPYRLISDTDEWQALEKHAAEGFPHLRHLLEDEKRVEGLTVEHDGMILDFSRQSMNLDTLQMLFRLATRAGVKDSIKLMVEGKPVNPTEGRSVLHMALRSNKEDKFYGPSFGGVKNVVEDVHEVLDHIEDFSERVRNGEWKGATGRPLKNVLAVGIGGSYLGADFVARAVAADPAAAKAARSRGGLRFLSNVDPVDAAAAVEGWDPAETLVVVISKTFTTAETMLNARTVRSWLIDSLGDSSVSKHMVAVSAAPDKAAEFGIDPNNVFGFWDWVGGRYSVSSAVGVLPLALHYGMATTREFLAGMRSMDRHFLTAPPEKNLPIIMGLLAIWQSSFQGFSTRALVCYSQAMAKFAPHIQQVAMESNGKSVSLSGDILPYDCAEVEFGEPGTNAQHSFFQLLHQGRVVPVDFIGFARSQVPIEMPGEDVANHDELMANFFAQPDALALGRTPDELRVEGVPEELIPHKMMPGNRPSTVLLIDRFLDARTTGQLLALYEHRIAVQGFVWGINSFDQYGVELGKNLGRAVRKQLSESRHQGTKVSGFNPSTTRLLNRYLGLEADRHDQ